MFPNIMTERSWMTFLWSLRMFTLWGSSAHPDAENVVHAGVLADYRKGKSVTDEAYAQALRRKQEFTEAVEALFAR